ncbi:C-type lectin domain family 4 member K [Dasypus novemcinctus]|uniref:C-type lectin domain family 4 member K n=1 Tax=Dasypus novemcinctus TaxID=9361 RepID=UPI00265FFE81|nr:C-type lectin domain family 4 member K [Dasypus novemcinctus]
MDSEEVPEVHFSVDKQNISLWPRERPSETDQPLLLRKSSTICATLIFLVLVLATSILLQAILYPWLWSTISDVKTNAQLLKGRMDNITVLGSDIRKNSGGVEAASTQIWMMNVSLDHVRSQLLTLDAGLEKANTQIQMLTRSWENVNDLYTQIPELKRDMDKASALNAKVRGLQSSLENFNKLLKRQNDILQVVSQGWKYFNENFYYFSHTPKTWYSAKQFCVSKESHLTSVTSESEQKFLYKTVDGLPRWIGLTKEGSEGGWYWVDDTPFNKVQSARFWIPGEPNNVASNEHCVSIRLVSLQSWNDDSCDNKFLFICKRPYIPSEP